MVDLDGGIHDDIIRGGTENDVMFGATAPNTYTDRDGDNQPHREFGPI